LKKKYNYGFNDEIENKLRFDKKELRTKIKNKKSKDQS
jgi:hypothetical protein